MSKIWEQNSFENQSDKIVFLISDELRKIKEDMYIERYMNDEQKNTKTSLLSLE